MPQLLTVFNTHFTLELIKSVLMHGVIEPYFLYTHAVGFVGDADGHSESLRVGG